MSETGTVEDKSELTEVRRWRREIELSSKGEKIWRETDAPAALKVYRNDGDEDGNRKETFNILWANTETQRMNLYNSKPRPDIRRRFRDKDPLGKEISEICERSASYFLDSKDFECAMIAAVLDNLLPGRAITRVVYDPTLTPAVEASEGVEAQPEVLADQSISYEQVQFDAFRRGPGKRWPDVPWIAYEHKLTKEQMNEKFPDFEGKIEFDCGEQEKEKGTDKTIFKRCRVWEIWDKDERNIKWYAPSYKDSLLGTDDDPMGLEGFFDIPMPLYAVESSTSLIPVTEYSMYQTLAKELESVTNRINKIVNAMRVRGIYDSSLTEMDKIFSSSDNDMIPSEDTSRFIEQGGFDKAIWMLPIDKMADVLNQLYQNRDSLMSQIYEATGISDIMRGESNPNETLGAQEIKANFGTGRLKRKQEEVARYARDLVRLTVEIVAEHFSPEVISRITGLKYPTGNEKALAQQQAQMMAQTGQEPPPQIVEVLSSPSWDEIMRVLKDDKLRSYRIDIETESTIQATQQKDQQNIAELMQAIGTYVQGLGPAVESGVLSMEAGRKVMMSIIRKFKLGREVEDALEEEAESQMGPNQQDQAKQAEQQQAQMEQQTRQQEVALEQAQIQSQERIKSGEAQMKASMEQRRMDIDAQIAMDKNQKDAAAKAEEMRLKDIELSRDAQKLDLERKKLELENLKRLDDRDKWEAEVAVKRKAAEQKPVQSYSREGGLRAVNS